MIARRIKQGYSIILPSTAVLLLLVGVFLIPAPAWLIILLLAWFPLIILSLRLKNIDHILLLHSFYFNPVLLIFSFVFDLYGFVLLFLVGPIIAGLISNSTRTVLAYCIFNLALLSGFTYFSLLSLNVIIGLLGGYLILSFSSYVILANRHTIAEYQAEKLAELNTASELKSKLIDQLSHEFHTPLTPIKLELEVLTRQCEKMGIAGPKSSLASISRNILIMETLVSDAVTLVRPPTKEHVYTSATDVRQHLAWIVQLFQYNYERNGANITIEDGLPPSYHHDLNEGRFKQVLINLFYILSKSINPTSKLVLEVNSDGRGLVLLFRRFDERSVGSELPEQFPPLPVNQGDGLGLALYSSNLIVAACGGTLQGQVVADGYELLLTFP